MVEFEGHGPLPEQKISRGTLNSATDIKGPMSRDKFDLLLDGFKHVDPRSQNNPDPKGPNRRT